MIVLRESLLEAFGRRNGTQPFRCRRMDDGDAFSEVALERSAATVAGSICHTRNGGRVDPASFGGPDDEVRILARWSPQCQSAGENLSVPSAREWQLSGYVRRGQAWHEVPVELVASQSMLFSRVRGLFESDALSDKSVGFLGQGSVGSMTALRGLKAGVGRLILVDDDRLTPVNCMRHVLGLSDCGRYKTKAMADRCHDTNPYAQIDTYEERISPETVGLLRGIARECDIIITSMGAQQPTLIANEVCLAEETPLIVAGAFRRAYGGQVFIVHPHEGPCYQCFVQSVPGIAGDREISTPKAAARWAYSDVPIEAEPGLENQIAPISTMAVTLAIQHLLEGGCTPLRSLDEDLVAPWYLYINYRAPGTDYERLGPLAYNVNGPRILRWMGIAFDRVPGCWACGSPGESDAPKEGVAVDPEDEPLIVAEEEPHSHSAARSV